MVQSSVLEPSGALHPRTAAANSCPAPNGSPIAHGDSIRVSADHERHNNPAIRYHAATTSTARGRNRAEAKTPRLKITCHNPGIIQTESGAKIGRAHV